jgi:hypothetical protein
MVYLLFSPNYGLEVDLPLELAYGTDVPKDIDQFWRAMDLISFSPQPQIDEGIAAVRLPDTLLDVPPEIQEFWLALRPTIVTILREHPTLVGRRQGPGRPPLDIQIVGRFCSRMTDKDPKTGLPRWQLFDRRFDGWTAPFPGIDVP